MYFSIDLGVRRVNLAKIKNSQYIMEMIVGQTEDPSTTNSKSQVFRIFRGTGVPIENKRTSVGGSNDLQMGQKK